jgi:hypothetical protein
MRTTKRCLVMVSSVTLAALCLGTPADAQRGQGGGRGGDQGAAQEGAAPPPIGFFGDYKVAGDKKDPSKLPFLGAWRINLDKSDPALRQRFPPSATNIFTLEGDGMIRHDIFQIYPPKVDNYKTVFSPDARSYSFKLDGKNIYENPQGPNGQGQTAAMWLIDRNTILRERMTKGVIDERVLYRVSPDGKTLTWTPFNADGNSGQMVWDRIELPK